MQHEPIFTPEQLAEVKAYALPHYVWAGIGDIALLAAYLLLLRYAVPRFFRLAGAVTSGRDVGAGDSAFRNVMERLWQGPGLGQALLFSLMVFLANQLVGLPVVIYFGYFLEKAHGQLNYTPAGFAWDLFKGNALKALQLCALTLGVYGLARHLKAWWWIVGLVAGLASLGSGLVDPYRSRLYFEQTPLPAGETRAQIEALLHRAQVPFSDIVVENTSRASKKVDVFYAGQGPTRRVIITDEFLAKFPKEEVLAAVAHEAGHVHQGNRPGSIASAVAIFAFMFIVERIFRRAARRGWLGIRDYADIRTLPIIGIAFFILTSLTFPVSAAFSREREMEADRFALALTGDPEAFESMLVRLARINKADPDPPTWVVWAGEGHPPIVQRIAAVQADLATRGRTR